MVRKCFIAAFVFAVLIIAIASILLIRSGVFLRQKSGPEFSTEQFKEAAQKAGGEEILGKEAAEIILQFGSNNYASSYRLTNCPAIAKMASFVGGEIVGMNPSGGGVPAHVSIRRGGHFDYQFVYVFGTGARPVTNSEKLNRVDGSVYYRNTASKGL